MKVIDLLVKIANKKIWEENKKLKDRINKAIQYIEYVKILNDENSNTTMRWEYVVLFPELEKILKREE